SSRASSVMRASSTASSAARSRWPRPSGSTAPGWRRSAASAAPPSATGTATCRSPEEDAMYGGTPKPLGPEFEALEQAGRPERDAERAHALLEAEAIEARHDARDASTDGGATDDRPNLIERLFRIGRGRN